MIATVDQNTAHYLDIMRPEKINYNGTSINNFALDKLSEIKSET